MERATTDQLSSNSLKKEIVFNATVLSLLLTVFLAALAPPMYLLNLAISLLLYGLGRFVRSIALRLIIFNGAGITAIASICILTREKVWLAVGISFLFFSLTSVLLRFRRERIS
ncbi:hypothetical protein [Paenibacillus senegalensis]|uniref:hypothetical protein n=1 Tax=Paenibacillus senegalensis TaxID=1465766 RepID=UPI000289B290|nr:hypothetical protein [Paenibacillus senegalensis]